MRRRPRTVGAALVIAASFSLAGCHRPDVVDRAPLIVNLRAYPSASLAVYAAELDPSDVTTFAENLDEKLTRSRIFRTVVGFGLPADLFIRVTLLDRYGDSSGAFTFAVELFDNRTRQLVGRFDVLANAKEFSDDDTLDLEFESKHERALARVADAIVKHLQDLTPDM